MTQDIKNMLERIVRDGGLKVNERKVSKREKTEKD